MFRALQEWAAVRGFRVACGGVRVLHEARAELTQRTISGELDAGFQAQNLGFFKYESSADSIRDVKAVIIAAVPRPAHRLAFELATGPLEVVLPPTYLRYSALFNEVRDDIISAIPSLRGHLEVLLAPLKAVACRLGLAAYGRNNLAYIPEWGSYFQLLGYVTDVDMGIEDSIHPENARLMPDCETCGVCASVCPTGAITDTRVLLHAEICTTLFSEQAGDLVHDLSGDCLFGCLVCQDVCPVNSGLLRIVPAGVSFDCRETEAVLRECPDTACPETASATRKLKALGLTEEPLIGRNLRHLIARHART